MIGDVLRARWAHCRARRLWLQGEYWAARVEQDRAIARYAGTRQPRRPRRALEFAVVVSAGADYACAMADTAAAKTRYRQVIDGLAAVVGGRGTSRW